MFARRAAASGPDADGSGASDTTPNTAAIEDEDDAASRCDERWGVSRNVAVAADRGTAVPVAAAEALATGPIRRAAAAGSDGPATADDTRDANASDVCEKADAAAADADELSRSPAVDASRPSASRPLSFQRDSSGSAADNAAQPAGAPFTPVLALPEAAVETAARAQLRARAARLRMRALRASDGPRARA
jgi:hypothetical protein